MDEFWKTALTALSSAGVAGIVLGWYLIKFEPSQKAMRDEFWKELDGLKKEIRDGFSKIATALYMISKADMLRLIASPHVSDSVKEAASALVKDIAKEVEKETPK